MHFLLASPLSFCYIMRMLPITIRKRTISEADLPLIQAIVDRHWNKGRKHISKVLCNEWNWRQPNGRLKDMACRELLLTLSRKGLINLPPRLISAHNDKRNRSIPIVEIKQTPLQGKSSEFHLLGFSWPEIPPLSLCTTASSNNIITWATVKS